MNVETAELVPESLIGLWDFGNPVESGERFRRFAERAAEAGLVDLGALAETQLARAFGLDREFDEGFALLDLVVQGNPNPSGELAARLGLERGRLLNSSGKREESEPEFTAAWEEARRAGLDGLAVDAAHMLGIVLDGQAGMDWNERALELALNSDQPAANKWKGSLLNNMGWEYHGSGDFERAMELFERALVLRIEQGKSDEIRVARWCVGRCLRSLGRIDEALAVQRALEVDPDADGYVFEEIGECFYAQDNMDDAKPNFAKAYKMLSKDPWVVANEAERLNRLRELGGL